jgi:hypothetical protein
MNGMADFLASQPMHVGFTSDQGGNSIELRWFRHKSNLHHVTKSCFACVGHDSISVIISLIIITPALLE